MCQYMIYRVVKVGVEADQVEVSLQLLDTRHAFCLHLLHNPQLAHNWHQARAERITDWHPLIRNSGIADHAAVTTGRLSIGAYMAWHRRICAMDCSVSQNWIGAGCVLQRPTHLSFRQPDSLLSVTVPFRSPVAAYGTVCQLTSRPQQLYLFSVLV